MVLGQEGPFEPGREPRATASAQSRTLHDVHDLRRRHFVDGLLKRAIAAVGAVRLQGRITLPKNAAQQDWFEIGHENRQVVSLNSRINVSTFSTVTFIRASSFTNTAGAP